MHMIPLIPTLKIKSVTRLGLEAALKPYFKKVEPGVVLDVGAKNYPYKKYIPFTKYLTLDLNKSCNPNIICDLHNVGWKSDYFDVVIATEIIEHLYDPQLAINEIYRILKRNGICILSTRFIYRYHRDPGDYYRFTWDSLNYLFRKYSYVEITHHGNRIQVLWELVNSGKLGKVIRVFLNVLNPLVARIRVKKTMYPCGFVVFAKK